MSGLPNSAGAEPDPPGEQTPTDLPSAHQSSGIHEDQIMCNWGKKPMDCIPSMFRPLEPLSSGFIHKLSEISLIAPGKNGLAAARTLIMSAFDDRCSGQESEFEEIQEGDLRIALVNVHKKLAAVGDISKARRENGAFLRSHSCKSTDLFDWPYDTVMAIWTLVKLTGGTPSKLLFAGRFLERRFYARTNADPKSAKSILPEDVEHAISDFKTYSSSLDSAPTRGDAVHDSKPISSSAEPDATVVKQEGIGKDAPQQDSGLCTTGSVFHPCLPPLDVLLSIAKAFYNARKQRGAAYGTGDGPTIMSQEVAMKGIYNDNRDAEGLGTFLRHDSRNYSYKHLRSNEEAIAALEKRFGEPFCEIFSCPDIQADQALRTTQGILSALHDIAQEHHISNAQTLRAVISEYFKKCVGEGKPHILTAAGLQQLTTELTKAATADDDGKAYKGWTSLGGVDAPITPTPQPPQQSRRRSRISSPSGFSQQPNAKKCKPGLTSAGRMAYVANMIPDLVAFPDASLRSTGSASRRSSTTLEDLTESVGSGNNTADCIAEPNSAATPTPAPRTGRPQPNTETEISNPLVEPEEGLHPGIGADDDKNAANASSSQNALVHVSQDIPVEDGITDTVMVGSSDGNAHRELVKQQLKSEVKPRFEGAEAFVANFGPDVERHSVGMTELRLLLQKANEQMEELSRSGLHDRIHDLGQRYIESETNADVIISYAHDTTDICKKIETEIATVKAESGDLKRQLREARDMAESGRDVLRNENADLKLQLQRANNEIESDRDIIEENSALKKRIQQAEEKAKSVEAEREALQVQHSALGKELQKKSKEQQELAEKLEGLLKSLRG